MLHGSNSLQTTGVRGCFYEHDGLLHSAKIHKRYTKSDDSLAHWRSKDHAKEKCALAIINEPAVPHERNTGHTCEDIFCDDLQPVLAVVVQLSNKPISCHFHPYRCLYKYMIAAKPSMGAGVLPSHVGALVVLWCLLATIPGAIVLPNRSLLHITISGVPCLRPGGIPSYTTQQFLARLEGAALVERLRGAGPHGEQDYQDRLGVRRDSGHSDIGDGGGKGSEGGSLPEVRGGMRCVLLRSLRALFAGVVADSFFPLQDSMDDNMANMPSFRQARPNAVPVRTCLLQVATPFKLMCTALWLCRKCQTLHPFLCAHACSY